MEDYSLSLMSEARQMSQTLCRLYLSREKCRASQPLPRLGPQSRGQAVRNRLGYILLACSSAGEISEVDGGGSACDHTAWGCVRWQPVARVHLISCTGESLVAHLLMGTNDHLGLF